MNAVTHLAPGVFAVTVPPQLTLLQRTTLYVTNKAGLAHPEKLVPFDAIYHSGIFDSRRQAENIVLGLRDQGWLICHNYGFKPSTKALNWLKAEGASHE